MLLVLLIGCAGSTLRYPGPLSSVGRGTVVRPASVDVPAQPRGRQRPGGGAAVAAAAQGFVGDQALVVRGERFRFDCSGFVEASLAKAGRATPGSSASLFEQAREFGVLHHRRIPDPGDVAFFDDTYDRNRNGRVDDPLSHVAVVVSVEEDGTIHLVHLGSGSVDTLMMNLRRPTDRKDETGKPLNDWLRVQRRSDPAGVRYLAGELAVGFASFWKVDPPVASTK